MTQHFFHIHGLSLQFLAVTVGLSYVLSTASVVMMVVHGFRHRTYAMPAVGLMPQLAICVICLLGPFSDQSHLFFSKAQWPLFVAWGVDAALLAVVFGQYLAYGAHDSFAPDRPGLFRASSVVLLGVVGAGLWTFIVFYQDYYVNEICPIAILLIAAGYVWRVATSDTWPGMSLSVAWLLGLSNVLLFGAVVLGNMSDPFPEAEYGYGFIYWLYGITLVLNFLYVYMVVEIRRGVSRRAARATVA